MLAHAHAPPNTPDRPPAAHNARPPKKQRPPLAPGLWTLVKRRIALDEDVVEPPPDGPAPPAPNPAQAAQHAFDELCLATT